MIIYSYQSENLVDKIKADGIATVEFTETNLYRHTQNGRNGQLFEAYMWMARKLSKKTGVWLKAVYGEGVETPTDDDGDYIDEEGRKLPILPFWGWYLTGGKNRKPDSKRYCFDTVGESGLGWNLNHSRTLLLTLEIPEKNVLLSDANAWYCALEGRPCYDYEDETTEQKKIRRFKRMSSAYLKMPEGQAKTVAAEALLNECVGSWDNILRLEGRRLREYMGVKERYDIQAVFPVILQKWVVNIEEVHLPNNKKKI